VNLLLDSHILLWWLSDSRRLNSAARKAVADSARSYVSAATVWEIAIKMALGKLEFRGNIEEQLALNNLLPLAVTVPHALAAGALPMRHSDPFDRMLIAQAKIESLTLMTHDARLRDYDVPVLVVCPYSLSLPVLTFSTARKASCGISTRPTRFIRRLPSFCFSSSLRLREISPP